MLAVWTLVVAAMPANAAPINQLPYASLSGTGLIDFEGVAAAPFPGTSIEGVLDLGGASFGERFDGQTLGISGNFDVLSGLPLGSPTLLAGGPSENLVAVNAGLTNTNDDPDGFGVDNIRFQQPIPEPASFVLVGLGLVATQIAARRRTRHRSLGIDECRQGKIT